ncbi:MAG: ABC transporter permease [Variovorax paradoxus]|uniref:ABC transporter permease n=1 Tax=Variovorax paradoxus TaxID=34073 RepID=A0A2W5QBW9_VARPD|nr:MAG: ABC transporter permease [Variovorax paradoxus]
MLAPLVPHRRRLWLYTVAVLVILFLVLPVLIVVPMSFSGSRFLDFPPKQWSLRWYERFFTSPDWYGSLLTSLKAALCVTLIATPLGTAAAWALDASQHRWLRHARAVILLPLMVPNIIVAVGIFYIYARTSLLGSLPGLVAAHAMLALPFVVLTVLAGLHHFDRTQELAARSLGCTRLSAFFKVTLPQIMPSVVSGALFAFVTSLDEVVISMLISAGENSTVTKVMFSSLRDEIDPTIATVSTLLIVGSFIAVALGAYSARRVNAANA